MNKKDISCNVCGWTGQRILKHLEMKEQCRVQTDMDKLKGELKKREKRTKNYYEMNTSSIFG